MTDFASSDEKVITRGRLSINSTDSHTASKILAFTSRGQFGSSCCLAKVLCRLVRCSRFYSTARLGITRKAGQVEVVRTAKPIAFHETRHRRAHFPGECFHRQIELYFPSIIVMFPSECFHKQIELYFPSIIVIFTNFRCV